MKFRGYGPGALRIEGRPEIGARVFEAPPDTMFSGGRDSSNIENLKSLDFNVHHRLCRSLFVDSSSIFRSSRRWPGRVCCEEYPIYNDIMSERMMKYRRRASVVTAIFSEDLFKRSIGTITAGRGLPLI